MAPCKEELELVRHSNDLRLEGVLMRQAYSAKKSDDWANYLGNIAGKRQAQQVGKCEGENATIRWSKKMRTDRALYRISAEEH